MVLDVVAVIFLILSTVRKLDVQGRAAHEFPHVPRAEFEGWRARESAAYSLGIWACLLKLVMGHAFPYAAYRMNLDTGLLRFGGFCVDAAWVVALIVAARRRAKARKLAARLGIDLRPAAAGE
jgi:hypothetical protein